MISPVPFNHVAKAFLATQASSASAERLFSDLGKKRHMRCHCLVSGTSEMAQIIRVSVDGETSGFLQARNCALRPQAASLNNLWIVLYLN